MRNRQWLLGVFGVLLQLDATAGELTPVGAEQAGNADGSIPAWTGGISTPVSGYQPGEHHRDPYASDPPLYTISKDNAQDYRAQLSAGQWAMLQKYPTFQLPVYPTRRSAAFSARVYAMTAANAGSAKLSADGESVEGTVEGFPFIRPANGQEVMWNHKLRPRGTGVLRYNNQIAPTASGQFTQIRIREESFGPYWQPGATAASSHSMLQYLLQRVESPARLAGQILLVHETLNPQEQPRQAWVYNPGQRRVRKAPDIAYDNAGSVSEGLRTHDMIDMFNGAMDRYEWTLVGKREMHVNYNAYRLHAKDLPLRELVQPGHLNPKFQRYELHRVWVVDAKLKSTARHINPRRTFYLDEDSWQILLTDHYDSAGQLWRHSEAAALNYYEVPLLWTTLETHHDLTSGRYISNGLDNADPVNDFNFKTGAEQFTPQALRTRGR